MPRFRLPHRPLLLLAALLAGAPLAAQEEDPQEWLEQCRGNRWGGSSDARARACDVRETTIAAPRVLSVDAGQNGGVSVRSWNGDRVRVVALISANARSDEQAQQDLRAIRIHTSGGEVRATGPRNEAPGHWSVSFTVWVPRRINLELDAHNGGISIDRVQGDIDAATTNGGLRLNQLGGDVKARTTNGGLHVTLSGTTWSGEGLDAQTTNGGVHLEVPRGYNAHLETGTVNGRITSDIDLPSSRRTRTVSMDLGRGGPPIRAVTTNGGVRIHRND